MISIKETIRLLLPGNKIQKRRKQKEEKRELTKLPFAIVSTSEVDFGSGVSVNIFPATPTKNSQITFRRKSKS